MKILKIITIAANVLFLLGIIFLMFTEKASPSGGEILIKMLVFFMPLLNLVWILYSPEIQKEKAELKKLKIQVEKATLRTQLKELET